MERPGNEGKIGFFPASYVDILTFPVGDARSQDQGDAHLQDETEEKDGTSFAQPNGDLSTTTSPAELSSFALVCPEYGVWDMVAETNDFNDDEIGPLSPQVLQQSTISKKSWDEKTSCSVIQEVNENCEEEDESFDTEQLGGVLTCEP
eukprot:SAG31_NODE_4904_length_2876_cov_3.048614_3_plen_148_part_00